MTAVRCLTTSWFLPLLWSFVVVLQTVSFALREALLEEVVIKVEREALDQAGWK